MRFVLVHDLNNPKSTIDRYQVIQSYHINVHHAIAKALENAGHHVIPIPLNINFSNVIKSIGPDFAFNCSIKCQLGAEKAAAPGILEKLSIPYTGSDAISCYRAYNKNRSKQIMKAAGIPTPHSFLIRNLQELKIPYTLAFPLFIKPAKGGCSFGIGQENLVRKMVNLQVKLRDVYMKTKQPVIIEEFIGGREFTVGILGNDPLRVFPIMEFRYRKDDEYPFRSFSQKMVNYEDEEFLCPAELTDNKRIELERLAKKAYLAMGCRDYARIDLRMDHQEKPYVLEINALPNLMPETSSYAIMARKAGLSFNDLIRLIVESATRRHEMRI